MTKATLMPFDDLMQTLHIAEPPQRWVREWDAARARITTGGAAFLADAALDDILRVCRFPDDIREPLLDAVQRVRSHPALSSLAWLWHAMLFFADDCPEAEFAEWPLPSAVMGEAACLFPAVITLSGCSRMHALHRARQIPEQVTRDTAFDLAIWMRHYHRVNGRWGFAQLPWMMRHCRGKLFRLGRLQFEPIPYPGDLRAFKHRITGEVLALSEPGISYRRDGLHNGTNEIFDEQAWTSALTFNETAFTGHPISPLGVAEQEQVTLPAAEWEQKLAPGDPVWNLHIPEDGKMAHDLCGESFRQAATFFPKHFPEYPPAAAFVTGTWLLEPQLGLILPPESNIVRFLREFYLSPALSYQREPLWRIFGSVPEDLTKAPRTTTLERAVLDYLLAGHTLGCANGFILCEDLEWGSQRYQRG